MYCRKEGKGEEKGKRQDVEKGRRGGEKEREGKGLGNRPTEGDFDIKEMVLWMMR